MTKGTKVTVFTTSSPNQANSVIVRSVSSISSFNSLLHSGTFSLHAVIVYIPFETNNALQKYVERKQISVILFYDIVK